MKKKYLSEWDDMLEKIVELSDKYKGVKPAETKRQKSARLRALRDKVGETKSVKPEVLAEKLLAYIQYKYVAEEVHEYDKYGVPPGTDVVSHEDDDIPPRTHLGDPPLILYKAKTIGSGYRKNSRFNIWITDTFLPRRPDIRAKLDAIDDTKKRDNAFKRLSYMLRKTIAERGLIPNGYGIYDEDDRAVGIKYNSGKLYKFKRRK